MDCCDCVELIARLMDGSLSQEDTLGLERHLSICVRCRAEFTLQKKIHEALAVCTIPGLPASFADRVTERVLAVERARAAARDERKAAKRSAAWVTLAPVLGSAAAMALILVLWPHLSKALAYPISVVANMMYNSVSSVGDAVLSFVTGFWAGLRQPVSELGGPSQSLMGLVLSSAIAIASVMWGLRRALLYMGKVT